MKKLFIIPGLMLVMPMVAQAQTTVDSIFGRVGALISRLMPILVAFAALFFVISIIGYLMASDDDKKDKAKSRIIHGLIALFIILSFWGLIGIFQRTFGIDGGGTVGRGEIPSVDLR